MGVHIEEMIRYKEGIIFLKERLFNSSPMWHIFFHNNVQCKYVTPAALIEHLFLCLIVLNKSQIATSAYPIFHIYCFSLRMFAYTKSTISERLKASSFSYSGVSWVA